MGSPFLALTLCHSRCTLDNTPHTACPFLAARGTASAHSCFLPTAPATAACMPNHYAAPEQPHTHACRMGTINTSRHLQALCATRCSKRAKGWATGAPTGFISTDAPSHGGRTAVARRRHKQAQLPRRRVQRHSTLRRSVNGLLGDIAVPFIPPRAFTPLPSPTSTRARPNPRGFCAHWRNSELIIAATLPRTRHRLNQHCRGERTQGPVRLLYKHATRPDTRRHEKLPAHHATAFLHAHR